MEGDELMPKVAIKYENHNNTWWPCETNTMEKH